MDMQDIMVQASKFMQAEIRDCAEWMEDGELPSDETIAQCGVLDCYDDGTKVFRWKGKECLIFDAIETTALDGTFRMPVYRKYIEEKLNG